MKVLIVDDDEDQLTVRCLLVEHHGFETVRADDVDSALKLASKARPQLAIVDIRLPSENDGLRLVVQLKTIDPDLRLIALTGSDADRLRTRPDMQVVDEVIQKGTSAKALITALNRLAAQRAA